MRVWARSARQRTQTPQTHAEPRTTRRHVAGTAPKGIKHAAPLALSVSRAHRADSRCERAGASVAESILSFSVTFSLSSYRAYFYKPAFAFRTPNCGAVAGAASKVSSSSPRASRSRCSHSLSQEYRRTGRLTAPCGPMMGTIT